tara:strand:- start:119 stop:436 length:318 start_codon:yes stop_codon:yes gene_type:complete
MLGNLEPEESVMNDSVIYPGGMLGQLAIALEKMGWEVGDDVVVEIAGTSVYEIDGAGTKWAPVKGTRKYNKDAFIIIKNRDRNVTVSSQPFGEGEFKPAHPFIEK